jgi:hypothetical protein
VIKYLNKNKLFRVSIAQSQRLYSREFCIFIDEGKRNNEKYEINNLENTLDILKNGDKKYLYIENS